MTAGGRRRPAACCHVLTSWHKTLPQKGKIAGGEANFAFLRKTFSFF